ncbi:MAG: hypothetical protein KAS12_02520, partial [Candidatus Aenigmarchaeota archaeon]|nr:hypothetical protein [Candidatus Aenigmarchaeota archaeon]
TQSYYKGDTVTLNSTIYDNGSVIIDPVVNWQNNSDIILSNEINTTWVIPDDYVLGINEIIINATRNYFTNGTNSTNITIFGKSNVNITEPIIDIMNRGNNNLTCKVYDNDTNEGIENYPVDFWIFNESSMELIDNKSEVLTDTNGVSKYLWNSIFKEVGDYILKCNISDNSTLYYNTTIFQKNKTINLDDYLPPNITFNLIESADNTPFLNLTFDEDVNCTYKTDYDPATYVQFNDTVKETQKSQNIPEQNITYIQLSNKRYTEIEHYDYKNSNHTIYVNCSDNNNNYNATNYSFTIKPLIRDKVFYEEDSEININITLEKSGLVIATNFSVIDSGYNITHNESIIDWADGNYTISYNISLGNTRSNGQYRVYVIANDSGVVTANRSMYLYYHKTDNWNGDDIDDIFLCKGFSIGYYFDETGCNWLADMDTAKSRRIAQTKLSTGSFEGYNCYDDIDNDGDLMVDCADPDCQEIYYDCRNNMSISSAILLDDPCVNNVCTFCLGGAQDANGICTTSTGSTIKYLNYVKPGNWFKVMFEKENVINKRVSVRVENIYELFNATNSTTTIEQIDIKELGNCTGGELCTIVTATNGTNNITQNDLSEIISIKIPGTVGDGNYSNISVSQSIGGDVVSAVTLAYTYVSSSAIVNEGEKSEYCNDTIDNDLNRKYDCSSNSNTWDVSCNNTVVSFGGFSGTCELGFENTCNDTFDNDRNGTYDCYDINCNTSIGNNNENLCNYRVETDCTDGFDNDGYQLKDCEKNTILATDNFYIFDNPPGIWNYYTS